EDVVVNATVEHCHQFAGNTTAFKADRRLERLCKRSLVVERHRQRQREGGSSFVAVDGEQNAELADAGELLPHRDEAFLNEGAKLLFASGVNLALEKSL